MEIAAGVDELGTLEDGRAKDLVEGEGIGAEHVEVADVCVADSMIQIVAHIRLDRKQIQNEGHLRIPNIFILRSSYWFVWVLHIYNSSQLIENWKVLFSVFFVYFWVTAKFTFLLINFGQKVKL